MTSQTASSDSATSSLTCDVKTAVVNDDVSSHPLLADQPEVVQQLVSTMMAKWNARASNVTSAPTYDDGAIQLNVLDVDGDLASSVIPQVLDAID